MQAGSYQNRCGKKSLRGGPLEAYKDYRSALSGAVFPYRGFWVNLTFGITWMVVAILGKANLRGG